MPRRRGGFRPMGIVMLANDHALVRELLPAYALKCLEAAEAADVARHLAGCPTCRAELNAYEQVADALALAAPESAPSAALRGVLLATVAAGIERKGEREKRRKGEGAKKRGRSPFRPLPPSPLLHRRLAVYAVVALAVVVLGGLLWAAVGRPAMDETMVSLAPSDVAPDAGGELRFGGNGATLEVVGLPVLPPEQQYQLWAVRAEQRASGAIFSVNENGWAEVAVALEHPAAEYDRFGITIEPAGGSSGPTGERVLGWRRE